jgi:Methyl-accepting chemotaxis protein
MKRRISIVARIAVSFAGLVVIILGATAFIVARDVQSKVEKLIIDDSAQYVKAQAQQVGDGLEKLRWELNAMALQPQLRSVDKKAVATYIRPFEGKFSPEVASFFYAWSDGSEITAAGGSSSLADRQYFKDIMAGKTDWAVSAPVVAKTLGVPIIPIAEPVKNEKGEIVGVVGMSMKLEYFSQVVSAIKLGSGGYGWVVDGSGLMIAHPKAEYVMKLDITKADETAGYKGLSAFSKRVLSSDSGNGSYVTGDGAPMFSCFAAVPGSPGWKLGVTMPLAAFHAASSSIISLFLVVIAGTILVFIVIALIMGRSIAAPIVKIVSSIKELAEGEADLTRELEATRNDEIGDLSVDFNRFVAKLREIVVSLKAAQGELAAAGDTLKANAEETAGASAQISERVHGVGEKARRQAAGVAESSSAVEQIAKNIESLERLISDQAASVTEASASIEEMVGNIASVTSSIGKMADEFAALSSAAEEGRSIQDETGSRIGRIAESSETLLEANSTIAKIASQTNLLAMNAAIEAAHAGEAGKGFSVVADEIRNLAETASTQSRTIGAELGQIRTEIEELVSASQDSSEAFGRVMDKLSDTDKIVQEVKSAMIEQKEGSSQVLEALKSMNDITASVRSGSKEMSAGNATILEAMGTLRDSAAEIELSMEEMASGAAAIAEGARKVASVAEGTSGTIGKMEEAIGRFVV